MSAELAADGRLTNDPRVIDTRWERYDKVAARITGEFPELASSVPVRKPPAGREQPLDRENLKTFDRNIEALVNLPSNIQ